MQQSQPMIPMIPSFPPSNITTEQIQKYLDDNKKLILAIMDNQNLGKLAECAHYQALLQKNLMYLAAIADAQPQGPMIPSQMAPHPAMQQGGFYMQHPQAAAVSQQPIFVPKVPQQFNSPNPMQDPQQQHQLHKQIQQGIQGQMGMRPGGANSGVKPAHTESMLGSGISGDIHGGNNQDGLKAAATEGQGSAATKQGGRDGESSQLKGSEDAK